MTSSSKKTLYMNKQILLLFFILIGVFMTRASYALYTSLGAQPCGKVISMYEEGVEIGEIYALGWVRGYISGRNYETNTQMNNIDADSIYYAVIKFCRENPLKDTANAAENIYSSVEKY